MNVTTYYRFSKHEQAEGTSIQRQREDCEAFASTYGWTITNTLIDQAKSAFTGENREVGSALHQFEEEVRAGLHHNTILLVERVDRLCRQGYDETQDFVKLCTRNGVTVATVDGAEIYRAGEKLDMLQVIKLLLKAELAHEESVKKSQRGKRRYEVDRAMARQTKRAMSKMMPGWLRVGASGSAEIVSGRDAVVRRVFGMADAGQGSLQIVRTLNAEFEPWPGANGTKAEQWNRSRVTRILKDRQVTGEYQPNSRVNGKSVPAGEPWPDHFPRVIAQDLFDRVNEAASARQVPAGKRSTTVANLFAGKLACHECGSWMLFERKRPAGSLYHGGRYTVKHDEASLRCSNAHYGKGCTNHATLSYYGFERAMLDGILHLALDDRSFAQRDDLGRVMGALAEARRTQDVASTKAKALWDAYTETQSKMAMGGAMEAEAEAGRLGGELVRLEAEAAIASGKADAEAHLSRVAEFRRYLYDDDLEVRARHRTKVAQGFRTIVKSVTFRSDKVAIVTLIGGVRVLFIKRGKLTSDFDFRHPRAGLPEGNSPVEKNAIRALSVRMDKQQAA